MSETQTVVQGVTADDAFEALSSGRTPEQIAEARIGAPPVVTTTEPPAQPAGAPPVAANPTAAPVEFDFSIFDGAKDFEEVKTKWSAFSETGKKYSELEKSHAELTGKWGQVEPILEVIPQMQNPYVDSIVHRLNTFMKKSGLPQDETGSSHRFALDVLTISDQTIETDPITAIALQKALQNPEQSKMGMEGLKRIVMLENGLDANSEEWTDDQKMLLKYKALEAGKTIKEKKAEFDNKDDFFSSLLQHQEQSKSELAKRKTDWDTELPSVLASIEGISEEFQIGDEKLKVNAALSKEDVQQVFKEISPLLSQVSPDENGKAFVKNKLQSALRSAYVSKIVVEAVTQDRKTFQAQESERLRAEQVNGGPVNRGGNPPVAGQRQPSPADIELDRLSGISN